MATAERIDGIGSDQEHIVALHKLMPFRVVTVAEGGISECHVGLKVMLDR